MKRPTTAILLGLLLIAAAFFIHRKPTRPPRARAARPAPGFANAVPEPTKPMAPPDPARGPTLPDTPPPPAGRVKYGAVRGTVRIVGSPPRRRRIKLEIDSGCQKLHPDGMLGEEVVVDAANNLQWGFVYLAGDILAPPQGALAPVLLDQVGCRFTPRVLGLRVHQRLNIFNNDTLLHNVHALPFENKEFNFGLPQAGLFETKTFSKPEVMVKIMCDIHPWMVAWVGVLDHPYFCVTGATGAYGIADLPPGRHRLKVWHERYASVESEVDVPPGGDVRLDFWLAELKK